MYRTHEPLILWQLTDTHLAADPAAALMGVNVLDSLRCVVSAAQADRPLPDLVVVTCDLVHDESVEGYRLLADTLRELPAPVYCLPGNHDAPARMREALTGEAVRYARLWLGSRWQVILLDSAEAGQASGRLSAGVLSRLCVCLLCRLVWLALFVLFLLSVAFGCLWF